MTRPLGPLCEASAGFVINTAAGYVSWIGTDPRQRVSKQIVDFVAKNVMFISSPICGLDFGFTVRDFVVFLRHYANASSHLNQSMNSLRKNFDP
jgi:hypothetical protein